MTLLPLVAVLMVVMSAWAYPKLNGWVYRRRVARDEAWAARVEQAGRAPAVVPAPHRDAGSPDRAG